MMSSWIRYKCKWLFCLPLFSVIMLACSSGSGSGNSSNPKIPPPGISEEGLFTCFADGDDPCGCLIQNDGSSDPLMWYRYSSTKAYNFTEANSTFIADFNSGQGHCGYKDWRIPSIIISPQANQNLYFGENGLSGDFAALANYASAHGYPYTTNLATWLNQNGFGNGADKNIQSSGYWSRNTYLNSNDLLTWFTSMSSGSVSIIPLYRNNYFILPVRGGGSFLTWNSVGNQVASDNVVTYTHIAINPSNNQPYIAYADYARRLTVKTYQEGWQPVIDQVLSSLTYTLSIAFDRSTPSQLYAVYHDGGVTIKRFNGSDWKNLGMAGSSDNANNYISNKGIAINPLNNHPYVVFTDSENANKATVAEYTGNSWENVGNPGFSAGAAIDTSIVFNPSNNQPYVVYRDGGNSNKVTVMTFNGTSWENVGNPGFSSGEIRYADIAFDRSNPSQPYVIYIEKDNLQVEVKRFNGSIWESLVNQRYPLGPGYYPSIAVNPINNQPYFVFTDGYHDGKATVMTFNGREWETVGNPGFSAGVAQYTNLAINPVNNQLYVIYQDIANLGRATIMTFTN